MTKFTIRGCIIEPAAWQNLLGSGFCLEIVNQLDRCYKISKAMLIALFEE